MLMIEEVSITTEDKIAITLTRYTPPQANDKIVLINAAMGVRQNYYADFAKFLCERGFVVVTWDYRGIGKSRVGSLRGVHADYLTWADLDQSAVIAWIRQHYPTQKLLAVGHSLGGQIPALTRHYQDFAGIYSVASQSGYWRLWDGYGKARMWVLSHILLPLLPVFWGYFPSPLVGMGQEIPSAAARTWAKGIRSRKYMRDLYPHHHFDDLRIPVHLVSFSDDDYAPKKAVDDFATFFGNAQVTRQEIAPKDIGQTSIGHFGYFRQKVGGALWADAATWLATH